MDGANHIVPTSHKGGGPRPRGKVTNKHLRQLLEYQNYRCALTGVELVPHETQGDHIISYSEGGKNTMDNIQLITSIANKAKGTLSNDDFIQMCCEVAAHANETGWRYGRAND